MCGSWLGCAKETLCSAAHTYILLCPPAAIILFVCSPFISQNGCVICMETGLQLVQLGRSGTVLAHTCWFQLALRCPALMTVPTPMSCCITAYACECICYMPVTHVTPCNAVGFSMQLSGTIPSQPSLFCSAAVHASLAGPCDHAVCRSCMTSALLHAFKLQQLPLRCPMPACKAQLQLQPAVQLLEQQVPGSSALAAKVSGSWVQNSAACCSGLLLYDKWVEASWPSMAVACCFTTHA